MASLKILFWHIITPPGKNSKKVEGLRGGSKVSFTVIDLKEVEIIKSDFLTDSADEEEIEEDN